VLLVVVVSCNRQVQPIAAVPAANCGPAPVVSAAPLNSTQLQAEELESPVSQASLHFGAPELGAHVTVADPRSYRVQIVTDAVGADIIGLDVALDEGRPRRVSVSAPTIALGQLLSEDAELTPGGHWLFAAPLVASGRVPRSALGGVRAATARRFFIGDTPDEAAGPSGAVWLRKPEGTYNGAKGNEAVLFDAFTFSALGAPIDTPCTITLRSASVSGQLRLASPFALHEVPSGLYDVSASASTARPSATHFIVNRELSGGP